MSDEGSVGALNGQRLNDGSKYVGWSQNENQLGHVAFLLVCYVHL